MSKIELDRGMVYVVLNDKGGRSPVQPTKGYPGDAGWDLYTSKPTVIKPHSFEDVSVDIAVALPRGVWGLIIGRSSTVRRYGLRVETAVIDNGYRGELFVGAWNHTGDPIEVPEGARLGQFILFDILNVAWRAVASLPLSERGSNGFGSTGV